MYVDNVNKNVENVKFENPKTYTVENEVKLNNPTTFKKGYATFGGWYFDKNLTNPANNGWQAGDKHNRARPLPVHNS